MYKTILKNKALAFLTFFCTAHIFANPQPNIIIIMVDDLGYADVGFNNKNSEIITPNIDYLAKGGTICSSGYSAHPFCGPSRAGLMTGRYPHAIGSQFNIAGVNPKNKNYGIDDGVTTDEIFISKVLQKSNYHTGLIGKWHLGANKKYYPNARGFDYFYGIPGGGHEYFPTEYKAEYKKAIARGDQYIPDHISPLEENGNEVTGETKYITDLFTDKAIDFIENTPKDKPYFLFLSYNAPHAPTQSLKSDQAHFPNLTGLRKVYAGMVYAVDRGVGKLTQLLKDKGDLENTLIVFLSDNGGISNASGPGGKPVASNDPLRGRKGDVYEGGYRVPMFFYWPGKVPANRIYEHQISALDFYPTFINLAKAQKNLPPTKKLDGENIWDNFIAGKNARNKPIFALRHNDTYSEVSARHNQWKIVKDAGNWELYNIPNDIKEENNVINKHPKIAIDLIQQAEQWSKTHIAPHFFYAPHSEKAWVKNKMPHFKETFNINNSKLSNQ